MMVRAHAAAPVRLDFAGGWTDVPPFSAREGGLVVGAAIELYARAEVELGGETIRLIAHDLNDSLELPNADALGERGRLDLLKAGLRLFPVGPCALTTRSDAPPGSGLGSSGAIDVAICAALAAARDEPVSPRDVAERAWRLEAVEAGIAGGKQDQFMSALGGFQALAFRDPEVEAVPLALPTAFTRELERRTLLCYTGASRFSGNTISRVMQAYERQDAAVTAALMGLKTAAEHTIEALRAGDIAAVARRLDENWRHQQALDPAMRTDDMARLEARVRGAGVLGGKAAGSGAGGCMFFITDDHPDTAAAAAKEAGATVLPVTWALDGVRLC